MSVIYSEGMSKIKKQCATNEIKIYFLADIISKLIITIGIVIMILGAMVAGILNYIGVPKWLYIATCLSMGISIGYLHHLHGKIKYLINGGKENESN